MNSILIKSLSVALLLTAMSANANAQFSGKDKVPPKEQPEDQPTATNPSGEPIIGEPTPQPPPEEPSTVVAPTPPPAPESPPAPGSVAARPQTIEQQVAELQAVVGALQTKIEKLEAGMSLNGGDNNQLVTIRGFGNTNEFYCGSFRTVELQKILDTIHDHPLASGKNAQSPYGSWRIALWSNCERWK